jgi:hypothetical protein
MKKYYTHTKLFALVLLMSLMASLQVQGQGNNVPFTNAGFEDNLTGWTSSGATISSAVTILNWTIQPADTKMARIEPNNTVANAQSALGLTGNQLASISEITNVGYIYYDLSMSANQSLTMHWNYVSQDYSPYDDGTFASLTGPGGRQQFLILARTVGSSSIGVPATGSYGSTGWYTVTLTAGSTAGTYRIGFGSFNFRDSGYNPILFVDNATGGTSSPQQPVVSTTTPSSITNSSATTGGSVSNGGSSTVTARGIVYSSSNSNPTIGGSGVTQISSGSGLGTFTVNLTGLANGTTYYVSAYATNSAGTSYGGVQTFTTLSQSPPTVQTGSISFITNNTATGQVQVTADGGATIQEYGIVWSTGTNPTTSNFKNSTFSNPTLSQWYAYAMGSLNANTTYYVRGFARNSAGTSYGTQTSFKTAPAPPAAIAATPIGANSFTARWNASTGAIKYYLDVSTNSGFSSYLPGFQNLDVGNVTSYNLTGLTSGGNYYYRLKADNGDAISSYSNTIEVTTKVLNNFLIEAFIGGNIDTQLAGQPFQIKITARDSDNLMIVDYSGNATISSNANLTEGATTANFNNGVLASHLVTLTLAGGEKILTATSGAVSSHSNEFIVMPAAINYYVLVANPDLNDQQQAVFAGTEFSVKATVYDEFGNVKTNYDGENDVLWTTTASSSPRGNPRVIPANGSQVFTAGVAVVGGFIFYNAQETPTITITDGPTSSPGTTAPIIVYNAPLNNFLVEPVPVESHNIGGVRKQAGIPFSVKVTARDVYFNIARDYAGNIRFKSSNDVLVQFPGGTPSFAGYQGIRTFADAITVNQIGSYWLRAADALQAFKSGELKDIVIGPGPVNASLSELTINYTSPVIAGDYVQVTIIPRDVFGNFLCTCQDVQILLQGDDEHRAGSGNTWIPIPSSALINTGNGSYVTNVRVTETGLNVFSAVVNAVTLNQTREVMVDPAPPSLAHTLITAASPEMTTDENVVLTVQLKDEFDNNRTTDDGEVTLSTTLGGFGMNNGPGSVEAVYNGSGTYIANIYASYNAVNHGVGNANITGSIDFTDPLLTDGSIVDNEVVSITEGLPNLVTSTIIANPTSISTDETSLITLQLKDHLGNLVQNNRGEATLLSNVLGELSATSYDDDGRYIAILSGDVRPLNGVGIAYITGSFAGSGSASGVNGYFNDGGSPSQLTTATVTITEGLPDVAMIQIEADPLTMTTDGSSIITVTLKDHLGNPIVNSRGTVALTTTLGAISIVTDHLNGTYSATLTGNASGTGIATISGTIVIDNIGEPLEIDDTAEVEITEGLPNLAQSTIVSNPDEMTTDGSSIIMLQLKDQWGNNLTTSRGVVSMLSTIGFLSSVTDHVNGTYSATLTGDTRGVNGTGTSNITASFIGDATAPTVIGDFVNFAQVEITEGLPAVATIDITALPTSMTTDESSTITVQLRDQFGNLILNNRGPVLLSTNLGVISVTNYTINGQYAATLTANSSGTGTATIEGFIQIDGSGSVLSIADIAEVEIIEGLPSLAQSSISAFPITMTTDESSLITLQLKDQWGNLLSSSRGDVTMVSTIGLLSSVADIGDGTYTAILTGDTRGMNGTGISDITASFAGDLTAEIVIGNFANFTQVEITEGLPSGLTTTITANPVEMTIDQSSLISVQLKDWLGNLIVNDRAEVSLFTDLGVLTPVNYIDNGIYIAALSGNDEGIGLATITGSFAIIGDITVADIIDIEDDATVLITEGLPSVAEIQITADPITMTTDESSVISVQLYDQFGNMVVNNRGTVALSTDRGNLSGVTYIGNGLYTATLLGNSDGVGIATITGTIIIDDIGGAVAIDDNAQVTITEGLPAVAMIQITADPLTMTTDESSVISVQLYDQFGNMIVNNRGTVALSTDRGDISGVTYSENGLYTATLYGNADGVGVATLTGTIIIDNVGDAVAIVDSAQVTITEGLPAVAQIQITADPISMTTDESSTITVQLRDQFGNTIVTNRGPVVLSTNLGVIGVTNYTTNGQYAAILSADITGTGLATITGTIQIDGEGAALDIADNATVLITEGLPSLAQSSVSASPETMTTDGSSVIYPAIERSVG